MDVLILGATVRAAACSARRAGLRPIGIDLFADRDAGVTALIPAADYPARLPALAAALGPALALAPWFYTGGLENEPALIDEIARTRPLWGNSGAVLRAVRDPFEVAARLDSAQLPHPAVRRSPQGLPRDGTWLVKPIASAGGVGIAPLGPGDDRDGPMLYYQERIAGPSLAALFVAGAEGAALVGITRQWVGLPSAAFAYAGSLGPWPVATGVRARIESLGRFVARSFGLIGLFGIDFILRAGVPYPVEINPRYTAAVEVLELAYGRSLLAAHRAACVSGTVERGPEHSRRVVGKAIVFALEPGEFAALDLPPCDDWAVPRIADIPHPGTTIAPGDPVLSVFASGASSALCRTRLVRRRAYWLRQVFRGS